MSDIEKAALICAPCTPEFAHPASTNGSIVDKCGDCGCDVWISPNAQALRSEHEADLQCLGCAMQAQIADPDKYVFANFTKEQNDELREAWLRSLQ